MSESTLLPQGPVKGGVVLQCQHCGSESFRHRKSQLNTSILSFFDLDWLNVSADVFVCDDCGFLHWFLEGARADGAGAHLPEENVPPDDTSAPSECAKCREAIPAGSDTCPICGWSYR